MHKIKRKFTTKPETTTETKTDAELVQESIKAEKTWTKGVTHEENCDRVDLCIEAYKTVKAAGLINLTLSEVSEFVTVMENHLGRLPKKSHLVAAIVSDPRDAYKRWGNPDVYFGDTALGQTYVMYTHATRRLDKQRSNRPKTVVNTARVQPMARCEVDPRAPKDTRTVYAIIVGKRIVTWNRTKAMAENTAHSFNLGQMGE